MTLLDLIKAALKEDMPSGDLTTESLALTPKFGRARLIAKQDLVLSGAIPFENSMVTLDQGARLKWHFEEGDTVLNKQIICTIQGDLVQILKAERVSLNFLMHLSGIATLTQQFVKQLTGTSCRILDTRKTLPGYRELEKRAVVHGGGLNHRLNLSSAILIKDNHISVMGGITAAVTRIRASSPLSPIEVEAKNLEEVNECVSLHVQRILLDNMKNEMITEARQLVPKEIELEASGNMTLERISSVSKLGVDFISVGALTHSAPSADVSLMFDWENS